MTVPRLRFKEFTSEWQVERIGNGYSLISGQHLNPDEYNHQHSLDAKKAQFPYFTGPSDFTNHEDTVTKWALKDQKFAQKDDILFTVKGSGVGTLLYLTLSKVIIGRQLMAVRARKNSAIFLFHKLGSLKQLYTALASGNMIPGLSREDILSTKISFPTYGEQKKIADFLTSVDEKIILLKKKKELLEQYKKGVMQKIFSQELRFKDDEDKNFPEWEERELGEVAARVTLKNKENNSNVLTISAQLGLISQLEYYNKSVSSSNITNYYLLHEGDFAYNKSYSNGYPMGAIKRLKKYETGVVSTLYICFRFNESLSPAFYEHYFESGLHNNQIQLVAQEGARNHGLLNIGVNDFFGTSVPLPTIQEQQKIADFLTAIDDKIALVEQQINKTELWKKGLLQQMFV